MSLIHLLENPELDEWRKGYHVFHAVHGTTAAFSEFDENYIGKIDPGWRGRGFYFSPLTQDFRRRHTAEYSKGYSWGMWKAGSFNDPEYKSGARNIPVLIRMKQPFTDQDAENHHIAWLFHKAGYKSIAYHGYTSEPWEVKEPGVGGGFSTERTREDIPEDAAKFTEVAMSLGYDGAFWGGEIVVFPPFAKTNIRPLYQTSSDMELINAAG